MNPAGPEVSDSVLEQYLADRVFPLSGAVRCPLVPPIIALSSAPEFRRFDFTFKCASDQNLQIRSAAFFDLVPSPTNFAQIQNIASGDFEFIRMGIMHIFTGVIRPHAEYIDALAPTICLIGAENLGVETRKPLFFALGLAGIIVALAVIKAVGYGGLPILLSVGAALFTANYLMISGQLPDAGRLRIVITLVFGLIHGFGFAAGLLELQIPPGRLAEMLLGFNIRVEIGQLTLVIGVTLAVYLLARIKWSLPRPITVDVASSFLVAEGLYWFVSRSFV
jgi:hypothetical protein